MIRLGVIGCGQWGLNYVRVFSELPSSRVTYCNDLNGDRLNHVKRAYKSIKITTDYWELLDGNRVDGVVVATPASTHYKIVKDCLSSGKDVLVEKPLTLSSAEGEELVSLAERSKRILMVGHIFEYNTAIKKLREYLNAGEMGDVYYLYSSRTGLGPIRDDVNAMWDLAPHDISILLYLLQEMPENVSARGQAYLQPGKEDVVFLTLGFPKRTIANVHVSWLDPHKIRKLTVIGSRKMAVFDDAEAMEKLKIFDSAVSSFFPVTSYGEFQLQLRKGDVFVPKLEEVEPLRNEANHFLECVKSRKKPMTPGEEGVRVVRILEAAQKSLGTNGSITEVN